MKHGWLKNYSFLAPAVPILVVIGVVAYQQWQHALDRRPDYENPSISRYGAALAQQPGGNQLAEVTQVQSGDVLVVQEGERSETLRLCGVDAPELEQPLGTESKEYLEQLIERVDGQIVFIPHGKDRQCRTIAEVFVSAGNAANPEEELFINAEQVAKGYAYVFRSFVGDCSNSNVIADAEAQPKQ